MKRTNIIIQNLNVIRNKGNCFRTLWKAEKALKQINGVIEQKDSDNLRIALSHVEIGEGAAELNDLVNRIISKYA